MSTKPSKIRSIQYQSVRGWVQMKMEGTYFWSAPVWTPKKSSAPTLGEILESRRLRGEAITNLIKLLQDLLEAHGSGHLGVPDPYYKDEEKKLMNRVRIAVGEKPIL